MNIDWDKFRIDIKQAAEEAGDETDDKLASRISSVGRLTDEDIKDLFPEPANAEKIAELIAVVKDATHHNTKVAQLEENIRKYSSVLIKLLAKIA